VRIAIDGRAIHAAMDGIGRYTVCMIEGLQALDDGNEYIVFTTRPLFTFPPGGRFQEVVYPHRHVHPATLVDFHRVLHRQGVDVHFCPHFYAPPLFQGRLVLTIHDLMWFQRAELQRGSRRPGDHLKAWMHRAVVPMSVRKARQIITVSQASARDIRACFPGLRTPVEVIPLGIDHLPEPARICPVMEREHTILFVGNAKPYKNLDGVVRCFNQMVADPRLADWRLKIPGRPDNNRNTVVRLVETLPCRDRVDWLGPVSEERLRELYAGAGLLLFPSRYEGFGLPVLEAMRHGTPVITSTTSSLPEVAGDAAILVDPEDVEAMANTARDLLLDLPRREELSRRGVLRARGYRWADAVERTHRLLVQQAPGV
jgi:glycosyltransferase involved in cell wall biosynthesis